MGDTALLEKLFAELLREERRGQRFFMDAAGFVQEPAARNLLARLAGEEAQHLDVLRAMADRIDHRGGEAPELNMLRRKAMEFAGEESTFYLVDDTEIAELEFPHLDLFKAQEFNELLKRISVGTILKFAMKIEYDNFKYIVGFMKLVQSKRNLELLATLADEEKQHFILLRRMYDRLPPGRK